MKKLLSFPALFLVLAASGLCAQQSANPDPWQELRFLIGSWEATTNGGAAQAHSSGEYSFQLELRGHVLARQSSNTGCKGPEDFDCLHSDLLYVYPNGDGHGWRAIYFDNEGHVIHYEASAPKPGTVVFLSDSSQPGPQFRLSYELAGSVMGGKFQVRMPGHAEFASYLEWSGKRR